MILSLVEQSCQVFTDVQNMQQNMRITLKMLKFNFTENYQFYRNLPLITLFYVTLKISGKFAFLPGPRVEEFLGCQEVAPRGRSRGVEDAINDAVNDRQALALIATSSLWPARVHGWPGWVTDVASLYMEVQTCLLYLASIC